MGKIRNVTETADPARRTQAQRRASTKARVLAAARKCFAEQGYAASSLDSIAQDCGISVRPVYHYFGSKKALFAAVNAQVESELAALIEAGAVKSNALQEAQMLSYLLDSLLQAGYRQIVLIDAPAILGRDRWLESPVMQAALSQLQQRMARSYDSLTQQQLAARMLAAALAEVAQYMAHAGDSAQARSESEPLIQSLLDAF